ncbi:MAG: hypothetical protein RR461_00035 [Angelakisella sp.]
MTINIAGFLQTLPVMFYGMVGIFIVMSVIAVTISLLKKFSK